ncbi:MAG: PQQ-binding-like beta-propeller repeat protein [candidate division Zixibacteria bacterium]|nr:PQQ-binding-like beta-propeller repeat protein [candidate division Zixibacteria bacterium]
MPNQLIRLILVLMAVTASAGAQNLLQEPNHASYDEKYDRYLISSAYNHAIVAIDQSGTQSFFLTNLGSYVFGNFIAGDTLYVTGSYGWVRAFDLNSGFLLWTKPIAGAHYTDGMAMDSSGYLYIADNMSDTDGKIYKLNPADQSYETFVGSGLPGHTYKMIYDEPNNRLLVIGHQKNSPITAVDLEDASVSAVVTPPNLNLGSIAMDSERFVYVTDYYNGTVYRYDQTFTNPPVLISEGFGSATGAAYDHVHNLLVIPAFFTNTVAYLPLEDTDGDDVLDLYDNCLEEVNPEQEDFDDDGQGDACDDCTDTDDDGFGNPGFSTNSCIDDNCPDAPNPGQEDTNGDDIGDACCCLGLSGNANGDIDDKTNISDVSYLLAYLFGIPTGPPPGCPAEGNANGDPDIKVNISDVSYLLAYLFGIPSGPEPKPCP